MSPKPGETIPISADLRELRGLELLRFDDACFRCVAPATHLRFHVRSGWLSVCAEHKSPPVETPAPKGKRHGS